jgi:hypothetical protein
MPLGNELPKPRMDNSSPWPKEIVEMLQNRAKKIAGDKG